MAWQPLGLAWMAGGALVGAVGRAAGLGPPPGMQQRWATWGMAGWAALALLTGDVAAMLAYARLVASPEAVEVVGTVAAAVAGVILAGGLGWAMRRHVQTWSMVGLGVLAALVGGEFGNLLFGRFFSCPTAAWVAVAAVAAVAWAGRGPRTRPLSRRERGASAGGTGGGAEMRRVDGEAQAPRSDTGVESPRTGGGAATGGAGEMP